MKAELGDTVSELQHRVDEALSQYLASATVPNFEHLSSLRRELHLHESETTRIGIQSSRQEYLENGDTILALLAQQDRPLAVISEILTTGGALATTQEDILTEFTTFYTTLYVSSLLGNFGPAPRISMLDTLASGWLSDTKRNLLVLEITPEEITLAIQSFPAGKARGRMACPWHTIEPTLNCLPLDWQSCSKPVYKQVLYLLP